MRKLELKLIILDIDGTLLDSTGLYKLGDRPRKPKLYQGAARAVDQLYFDDNLMLGIATSMCRASLNLSLKYFFQDGHPFIITKSSEETAPKPDPQMLLEILDEVEYNGRKLSPVECLMVGDSENDMIMADKAGIFGLVVKTGVPWDKTKTPESTLGVIDNISCLPMWLEENMR